jgi:hypothetical protein
MNSITKLNVLSILYALMIFLPLELVLNVYRIGRLIGWEVGPVNMVTGITLFIEMVSGIVLLMFLTKKWMELQKARYWTVILWVPYFVLFVYIFAALFPMTYQGDIPSPGAGLLAIGVLLVYPFYILGVNFISAGKEEKKLTASVFRQS